MFKEKKDVEKLLAILTIYSELLPPNVTSVKGFSRVFRFAEGVYKEYFEKSENNSLGS